jgi:hypothetical protein
MHLGVVAAKAITLPLSSYPQNSNKNYHTEFLYRCPYETTSRISREILCQPFASVFLHSPPCYLPARRKTILIIQCLENIIMRKLRAQRIRAITSFEFILKPKSLPREAFLFGGGFYSLCAMPRKTVHKAAPPL